MMVENDLNCLAFQVLGTEASLNRAKELVGQREDQLIREMAEHDRQWLAELNRRLDESGLTWCTSCVSGYQMSDSVEVVALAQNQAHWVLCEGRGEVSCGYENSCSRYEDYRTMHRVCDGCRTELQSRHGWHGPYNNLAHTQLYFYAFDARRLGAVIEVCRFGTWEQLTESERAQLEDKSANVPDVVANSFGSLCSMPPRLRTQYHDTHSLRKGVKIVRFDKPVLVAVA